MTIATVIVELDLADYLVRKGGWKSQRAGAEQGNGDDGNWKRAHFMVSVRSGFQNILRGTAGWCGGQEEGVLGQEICRLPLVHSEDGFAPSSECAGAFRPGMCISACSW
jgi:hypothetical protein